MQPEARQRPNPRAPAHRRHAGAIVTAQLPVRVPRRSDYDPIVKGLKPLCAGEELELRTSLLLMRDRAMATKPNACEPSWHLLDVVENVTRETALNPRMDLEQLRELRRLCVMCVCNASSFDTLFQPRLPLGEGEAK
jgi:hypothetical protein